MRKRKPKFKVGQVVFVDECGFYGFVKTFEEIDLGELKYEIQSSPSPDDVTFWSESQLRPLTARERG